MNISAGVESHQGMGRSEDITQLLHQLSNGGQAVLDQLFPLVYSELRRLAKIQRQRDQYGLNTTALVHESYLKLIGQNVSDLADRQHFFALVSRAMRQIVVDFARARMTRKRGGGMAQVELEYDVMGQESEALEMIALDEALDKFANLDKQMVSVFEFRYFSGMSTEETARMLGVSDRTVQRQWRRAQAWLSQELAV